MKNILEIEERAAQAEEDAEMLATALHEEREALGISCRELKSNFPNFLEHAGMNELRRQMGAPLRHTSRDKPQNAEKRE